MYMEMQGTQNVQNDLEKGEKSWRTHTSSFQNLLRINRDTVPWHEGGHTGRWDGTDSAGTRPYPRGRLAPDTGSQTIWGGRKRALSVGDVTMSQDEGGSGPGRPHQRAAGARPGGWRSGSGFLSLPRWYPSLPSKKMYWVAQKIMCMDMQSMNTRKKTTPGQTTQRSRSRSCVFLPQASPASLQKDVSLSFVFIILLLLYTFFFLSNIFLPVFKVMTMIS